MSSVGEALRREIRDRMAAMSPGERVALTATLAEWDLRAFASARQLPLEAARRLMRRTRQTGRLRSRVAGEPEP